VKAFFGLLCLFTFIGAALAGKNAGEPSGPPAKEALFHYCLGLLHEMQAKRDVEEAGAAGRVSGALIAGTLQSRQEWQEAAGDYEKAVQADPESLAPLERLARGWLRFGGVQESEKAYRRILERDPNNIDSLSALISIYVETARPADAVAAAEKAAQAARAEAIGPRSLRLQMALINFHRVRHEGQKALAIAGQLADDLQKWDGQDDEQLAAFKMNPGTIAELRIEIAVEAGQRDSAVKVARDFVADNPRLPSARNLLALTYGKCRRNEEALQTLEKALDEQVSNLDTLMLQANVLEKIGKYEKAIQVLENAYSQNKDKLNLANALAGAYQESGRFEQAENILAELLSLNPDDPNTNNSLAYFWAERGIRLDEAEKLAKKALEAEPHSAAFLDTLAWVNYQCGQYERARSLLEQALLYGEDSVIFEHLGDACSKLGLAADAEKSYRLGLEKGDPDLKTEERLRKKLLQFKGK
jgi:tetratricopeptide (TPR) repeat protein